MPAVSTGSPGLRLAATKSLRAAVVLPRQLPARERARMTEPAASSEDDAAAVTTARRAGATSEATTPIPRTRKMRAGPEQRQEVPRPDVEPEPPEDRERERREEDHREDRGGIAAQQRDESDGREHGDDREGRHRRRREPEPMHELVSVQSGLVQARTLVNELSIPTCSRNELRSCGSERGVERGREEAAAEDASEGPERCGPGMAGTRAVAAEPRRAKRNAQTRPCAASVKAAVRCVKSAAALTAA